MQSTLMSYIPHTGKVLEIGPLDRPHLREPDYDVYYADTNTTERIKELYTNDYPDPEKIVPIDFPVGDKSYLEAVGDIRFAAVFSSHVIEHTYDVIKHLREISEILEEGGFYVLKIPDKRYYSDHFREVTPFRDAYDVFCGGNIKRLLFDSDINSLRYDPSSKPNRYWSKEVSFAPQLEIKTLPDYNMPVSMYDWIGHIWVFTYISFLGLIRDCLRFNLLPFTLEYHREPEEDSPPSMDYTMEIVLRKDSSVTSGKRTRTAEILRIQRIIEETEGITSYIYNFINKQYGVRGVYIYGAGNIAELLLGYLKSGGFESRIEGFVITDGQIKQDYFSGKPVVYLSELAEKRDNTALIVATGHLYRREMIRTLVKYGFSAYEVF